ncbi:MAG TPA: tRNA pseudouridine(38-40) synthase TruA [Syntrophales bacterium]|nr:tRNA pseudouridine(38-40) synthase TruA [Syntrophales bacterium]HOL58683.1 tRNA pseudouridine(38-40) synthase TruA [Syntrophales bacterium]HPO35029.1 tRNA pseudouridine(38-40) synthase TruA [Syntrophales bacterium]
MRNLKLTIEYDGTNYCGWQRQKNGISIQGVLEEKLRNIVREEVKVVGSGRTDAGVHALGQIAHVHLQTSLNVTNILRGVNSLLPVDIAVKGIEEVPMDFHARYDAVSKVYLYRICNQPTRLPLEYRYAWSVFPVLDVAAMGEALSYIKGTHDFTSFSAVETKVKNKKRTILSANIFSRPRGIIEVEIEADGFLRHMVRVIVGTLVEVGKGKMRPTDIQAIIQARDRAQAGPTAPPQGLFLKDVKYGR